MPCTEAGALSRGTGKIADPFCQARAVCRVAQVVPFSQTAGILTRCAVLPQGASSGQKENTSERSVAVPVWYVYLVQCVDATLYCGVTTDVPRRLAQHNGEIPGGARYTRSRRPVRLLAQRACAGRSEALRLEYAVKQCPAMRKLAFLQQSSLAEANGRAAAGAEAGRRAEGSFASGQKRLGTCGGKDDPPCGGNG